MTQTWRVDDLAVGFNRQRILVRGITMTVSSGDFIAVTGPNGVGKTCLLRTFAGEIQPCLGSVTAPIGFGHAQLGIVPQSTDIELQVPMTLREMITLGSVGQQRHPSASEIEALSKEVGLSSHQLQQQWSRSSGGEKQRCLVARALVRQPELVLMDEATSNLDPATTTAVLKMLRRYCQDEGLVVIAVIHQDELVETYADCRLHLDTGGCQLSAVNGS